MGADYEKGRKGVMHFNTNDTIGVGATRYFSSAPVPRAAFVNAACECPFDGVITEMRARAHIAPGAGQTFTYTLYVNGVPTAMTCVTTGAAVYDSADLANPIRVAKGDDLAVQIVVSAAAGIATHVVTFELVID